MRKANNTLLNDLQLFIEDLKSMKLEKAFEVACGECHVTKGVLLNKFNTIDLLD